MGSNPLVLTQLHQTNIWNFQSNLILFHNPEPLSDLSEDPRRTSSSEFFYFSKITDKLQFH
jgi:hypothetical protein